MVLSLGVTGLRATPALVACMSREQIAMIDGRYRQRRASGRAGWADAGRYDRQANAFDRLVADYRIPGHGRVLELGCGSGTTVLHMADEGFEAYGVDLSETAIAWAKDNGGKQNVSAHFSVGNVTDLQPFPDDFFDAVIDGDCLWMVLGAERTACFASVLRKLKPGGIFQAHAILVKDGVHEPVEIAPGAIFDPVRLVTTVRHVPMYQFSRRSGFLKEVEDAGFEILRTAPLEFGLCESNPGNDWPFVEGSIVAELRKPSWNHANQSAQRTDAADTDVFRDQTIMVRAFKPEDAQGVAEVEASATATLRQVYRPNQKALSHKSKIMREMVRIVAECQGRIVGTTQYYVDGEAIRIIGLGVHGDFRHRGVARALVSWVTTRAREQSIPCIVARTVKETGNVPIFQMLGFDIESKRPDEYADNIAGGSLTDVSLRMNITSK